MHTTARPRIPSVLRAQILRVLAIVLALVPSLAHARKAAPKKDPAVHLEQPSERLALSVLASHPTGVSRETVRRAAKTLVEVSTRYEVDPFLLLGVIRVESAGWNHARSECDARGLMQIRPFVGKALAKELGVRWDGADSLHDPEVNVRLGVHYLASLIERYDGDVDEALLAYSMGPTKLDSIRKRGKRPVDDYPIMVRWFADHYRALAAEHGDLEPGLSRFEVGLLRLEKKIGGKPRQAYVLATGRQPPKPKAKASATATSVAGTPNAVEPNSATLQARLEAER